MHFQLLTLIASSFILANAFPLSTLPKRDDTKQFHGDATFYQPEADACGTSSTADDLVAALNSPQFADGNVESDENPNCGKIARITRGDKHVKVKIVDLCPECHEGDLDLSPAAFNKIADPIEGRVKIAWTWDN
ncbi:Expansin-A1 .2 [Sugiyamaella lignohabitans]|uniref:Expansin-A1.2 n=1 Tax=Sugiyamaella lignohabitans TaxID=796027 RepID=A0A161HKA9_9ASCO|nr:Expansin-A1 .2 [Sugiyamaella lignohabitans]ANB13377.1 Expansin-A1 .2 [Sugiyamaella lignohabitans]